MSDAPRSSISVDDVPPTPDEYRRLRLAAGLSDKDPAAAAEALPRSLRAVTVRDAGDPIAMGRIVGDGLHVQVVDIAVRPDRQGEGWSRIVMERLMAYVATLPRSTTVSLFADVDWLYDKFGFERPQQSVGMLLRHWPTSD